MSNDSEDAEYLIPLQDQRVFGAGIKRKRVPFLPASSTATASSSGCDAAKRSNLGDLYLSIVLPDHAPVATGAKPSASEASDEPPRCEICQLPLDDSTTSQDRPAPLAAALHDASLAHQVCLAHSHPPSHLDRQRKGLRYLEAYGWDPDSRRGLGAAGEGIRAPIKARVKNDTLGLGVAVRSPTADEEGGKKKAGRVAGAVKVRKPAGKAVEGEGEVKKDAKAVRMRQAAARRESERLRRQFYGSDELEKYLGPEA